MADDLLEIPAFLDRRGEKAKKVTIPERKSTMPSVRRVAAMKRANARALAATKRAEALDTKHAVAPEELIDQAAEIARKK